MRAKILKIIKQKDKSGRDIFIICFKAEDGKSYRTWVGKAYGNYLRWFTVIQLFSPHLKQELWLDNLHPKGNTSLIDADSLFSLQKIDNLKEANNYLK